MALAAGIKWQPAVAAELLAIEQIRARYQSTSLPSPLISTSTTHAATNRKLSNFSTTPLSDSGELLASRIVGALNEHNRKYNTTAVGSQGNKMSKRHLSQLSKMLLDQPMDEQRQLDQDSDLYGGHEMMFQPRKPMLGSNQELAPTFQRVQPAQTTVTYNRYQQQHKNLKPVHVSISQQTVNGLLSLLLLSIISICGCIGTIFIMSALTLIESLQTRGNCYLVSLAMSHLIVALFVIPSSALHIMAGDSGISGQTLCHYQWLTLEFSLIVGQLSFMLIAADNYLGYCCSEKVVTSVAKCHNEQSGRYSNSNSNCNDDNSGAAVGGKFVMKQGKDDRVLAGATGDSYVMTDRTNWSRIDAELDVQSQRNQQHSRDAHLISLQQEFMAQTAQACRGRLEPNTIAADTNYNGNRGKQQIRPQSGDNRPIRRLLNYLIRTLTRADPGNQAKYANHATTTTTTTSGTKLSWFVSSPSQSRDISPSRRDHGLAAPGQCPPSTGPLLNRAADLTKRFPAPGSVAAAAVTAAALSPSKLGRLAHRYAGETAGARLKRPGCFSYRNCCGRLRVLTWIACIWASSFAYVLYQHELSFTSKFCSNIAQPGPATSTTTTTTTAAEEAHRQKVAAHQVVIETDARKRNDTRPGPSEAFSLESRHSRHRRWAQERHGQGQVRLGERNQWAGRSSGGKLASSLKTAGRAGGGVRQLDLSPGPALGHVASAKQSYSHDWTAKEATLTGTTRLAQAAPAPIRHEAAEVTVVGGVSGAHRAEADESGHSSVSSGFGFVANQQWPGAEAGLATSQPVINERRQLFGRGAGAFVRHEERRAKVNSITSNTNAATANNGDGRNENEPAKGGYTPPSPSPSASLHLYKPGLKGPAARKLNMALTYIHPANTPTTTSFHNKYDHSINQVQLAIDNNGAQTIGTSGRDMPPLTTVAAAAPNVPLNSSEPAAATEAALTKSSWPLVGPGLALMVPHSVGARSAPHSRAAMVIDRSSTALARNEDKKMTGDRQEAGHGLRGESVLLQPPPPLVRLQAAGRVTASAHYFQVHQSLEMQVDDNDSHSHRYSDNGDASDDDRGGDNNDDGSSARASGQERPGLKSGLSLLTSSGPTTTDNCQTPECGGGKIGPARASRSLATNMVAEPDDHDDDRGVGDEARGAPLTGRGGTATASSLEQLGTTAWAAKRGLRTHKSTVAAMSPIAVRADTGDRRRLSALKVAGGRQASSNKAIRRTSAQLSERQDGDEQGGGNGDGSDGSGHRSDKTKDGGNEPFEAASLCDDGLSCHRNSKLKLRRIDKNEAHGRPEAPVPVSGSPGSLGADNNDWWRLSLPIALYERDLGSRSGGSMSSPPELWDAAKTSPLVVGQAARHQEADSQNLTDKIKWHHNGVAPSVLSRLDNDNRPLRGHQKQQPHFESFNWQQLAGPSPMAAPSLSYVRPLEPAAAASTATGSSSPDEAHSYLYKPVKVATPLAWPSIRPGPPYNGDWASRNGPSLPGSGPPRDMVLETKKSGTAAVSLSGREYLLMNNDSTRSVVRGTSEQRQRQAKRRSDAMQSNGAVASKSKSKPSPPPSTTRRRATRATQIGAEELARSPPDAKANSSQPLNAVGSPPIGHPSDWIGPASARLRMEPDDGEPWLLPANGSRGQSDLLSAGSVVEGPTYLQSSGADGQPWSSNSNQTSSQHDHVDRKQQQQHQHQPQPLANDYQDKRQQQQQVFMAVYRKNKDFYWPMFVGSIVVPSLVTTLLFVRAYLSMKEFKTRPYKPVPVATLASTPLALLTPRSPIPLIVQRQVYTFDYSEPTDRLAASRRTKREVGGGGGAAMGDEAWHSPPGGGVGGQQIGSKLADEYSAQLTGADGSMGAVTSDNCDDYDGHSDNGRQSGGHWLGHNVIDSRNYDDDGDDDDGGGDSDRESDDTGELLARAANETARRVSEVAEMLSQDSHHARKQTPPPPLAAVEVDVSSGGSHPLAGFRRAGPAMGTTVLGPKQAGVRSMATIEDVPSIASSYPASGNEPGARAQLNHVMSAPVSGTLKHTSTATATTNGDSRTVQPVACILERRDKLLASATAPSQTNKPGQPEPVTSTNNYRASEYLQTSHTNAHHSPPIATGQQLRQQTIGTIWRANFADSDDATTMAALASTRRALLLGQAQQEGSFSAPPSATFMAVDGSGSGGGQGSGWQPPAGDESASSRQHGQQYEQHQLVAESGGQFNWPASSGGSRYERQRHSSPIHYCRSIRENGGSPRDQIIGSRQQQQQREYQFSRRQCHAHSFHYGSTGATTSCGAAHTDYNRVAADLGSSGGQAWCRQQYQSRPTPPLPWSAPSPSSVHCWQQQQPPPPPTDMSQGAGFRIQATYSMNSRRRQDRMGHNTANYCARPQITALIQTNLANNNGAQQAQPIGPGQQQQQQHDSLSMARADRRDGWQEAGSASGAARSDTRGQLEVSQVNRVAPNQSGSRLSAVAMSRALANVIRSVDEDDDEDGYHDVKGGSGIDSSRRRSSGRPVPSLASVQQARLLAPPDSATSGRNNEESRSTGAGSEPSAMRRSAKPPNLACLSSSGTAASAHDEQANAGKKRGQLQGETGADNKVILCTYSYMTDDQLLKSNMIVFAVNLSLWFPFMLLLIVLQYRETITNQYKDLVWWLAILNCCSCSYVYALTNKDFREAFNKLFYYCCCKSHVTFQKKTPIFRRQLDVDSRGNLRVHIIPGLNVYSSKMSGLAGGGTSLGTAASVPSGEPSIGGFHANHNHHHHHPHHGNHHHSQWQSRFGQHNYGGDEAQVVARPDRQHRRQSASRGLHQSGAAVVTPMIHHLQQQQQQQQSPGCSTAAATTITTTTTSVHDCGRQIDRHSQLFRHDNNNDDAGDDDNGRRNHSGTPLSVRSVAQSLQAGEPAPVPSNSATMATSRVE